ncbi:hypothetical protein NDU88_001712 [Pleurodeles waltl]|uniref:Retrotransposon gag domain-containing protein n=1 Tax=Pleurodeles waltl TaxID=8319 RepID=A0AAV7U786_PLEWA|nr:hypothetical protein NDU88_001712 [Pleurodeles waltl]
MLLHLWGTTVHKLGKSVVEEGPPHTYQSLKRALTAHFKPLANLDYERFLLCQARRLPEESLNTFYARLKELASTCMLPSVDDEISAQFIQGCASVKLRENILQLPEMSMANILMMGRPKELSKVRAANIEGALQSQVKAEPVNAVTSVAMDKKKTCQKPATSPQMCYLCGQLYPHQGPCSA